MAGPATTVLNLDLVTFALIKTNVISENESPSAEQGAVALETLNDAMAELAANGTDLGWWPQTSLAAVAPLEESDVRAVKLLLCSELAAHYGVQLDPILAGHIDAAFAQLTKRYWLYTESASELPREQAVIDRTGQNL
jgi:hypothetical protein